MLIGGLIALLSLLLGSESMPFLIPEEEKVVRKVIVDKDKRKQLKLNFAMVGDKEKAYKKDRKKFFRLLDEVTREQSSTSEDFAKLGEEFQDVNAEVYSFMVNIRLSVGKIVTTDEWNEIIQVGEKEFYKSDKQYEKAWPRFEKKINKLNAQIRTMLANGPMAILIQEKLTSFGLLTLKNAKALNTYNVYENEVYNNIHSSKEELEAVSVELLQFRAEVYDEYVAIHQLIAKNTSEKEWRKIVKDLNKLF